MPKTFEEWLQEKYLETHPQVLKFEFEKLFDAWLEFIQPDEWIKYGHEYGIYRALATLDKTENIFKETFKGHQP